MQQLFHLSRLLFLLRKDFVSALKNAAVFTLLSPRGAATKKLCLTRQQARLFQNNNRNYHIVIVNSGRQIRYRSVLDTITKYKTFSTTFKTYSVTNPALHIVCVRRVFFVSPSRDSEI